MNPFSAESITPDTPDCPAPEPEPAPDEPFAAPGCQCPHFGHVQPLCVVGLGLDVED